ncbi:DUF4345 family protein [Nocardia crassostreae]|uniref:DUF4345 family protein n=1 Tax=Nocardia crassostreae TaxID=53428 RepID=UPI000A07957D|nr:DUF4345 family protein [Nocardia crassostreae]
MTVVISVVVAVLFAGIGAYALVSPGAIVRPFGIAVDDVRARYEVRAVCGGFGLAMAVVLVAAAADVGSLRAGIMVAVGAALAGMAFGRVVAAVIDERTAFYPVWFFAIVEAVAAGALLAGAAIR